MEIFVRDRDFKAVDVIDVFDSLIWTERFYDVGDFEIYCGITTKTLSALKKGYYINIGESDEVMVIESVNMHSNTENGNKLIVKGRALSSLLERRIIWSQTILTGSFEQGIYKLLDDNPVNPTNPARQIINLFYTPSNDPAISELTIDSQYTGENLLDVIQKSCKYNEIGFRVRLSPEDEFIFDLYSGVDRSYQQETRPYVVFSPTFDNIISGNYTESDRNYRSVALVLGEGEGVTRKSIVSTILGEGTDLDRREIMIDARDISRTTDAGTMTEPEYEAVLNDRGQSSLLDYLPVRDFEGEADATRNYKYGVDFWLGDIVQIENEYGEEGRSRVTEVIKSQNNAGISIYPKFVTLL